MRTELENQDIEAIAHRVVELLKPIIIANDKCADDSILDVKALSAYFKVDENWIYQKTRKHEIPFIKKGKRCLFRKSAIDAWLNQDAVKPLPSFNMPKR
jgi:excisionase family DNA binding protein